MNLSTKCNCCIKEDVCNMKAEYQDTETAIKKCIKNENIEVSIKCNKFSSKRETRKEVKI